SKAGCSAPPMRRRVRSAPISSSQLTSVVAFCAHARETSNGIIPPPQRSRYRAPASASLTPNTIPPDMRVLGVWASWRCFSTMTTRAPRSAAAIAVAAPAPPKPTTARSATRSAITDRGTPGIRPGSWRTRRGARAARLSRPPSVHREAATDRDRLPGDEGGAGAGQKGYRRGQVLGLGQAPHRDRPGQRLPELWVLAQRLGHHGRVGRTGADTVDGDAPGGDLAGQRLGEGDDAALGRSIDGT